MVYTSVFKKKDVLILINLLVSFMFIGCSINYRCVALPSIIADNERIAGHCKELYSVIEQENAEIFEQRRILDNALLSDGSKSGFKPLVLLPDRMECCGKKVVVRYVEVVGFFLIDVIDAGINKM